ncbi:MAG: hypothetical protein KBG01_06070 [Syntrophobacterales bacterium]|nr:hypothetical protein [Syntrophobacterales bacterium]
MKMVEEIPLPNGLVAEVWDRSRAIAADTTKVALLVRVKVTFKEEYFSNEEQLRLATKVFGPDVYYELKKERTFVPNRDVGRAFQSFLEEFKRDALPYISKEKFPAGFARSKYLDIQKHPYKYGLPAGKGS